MGKHPGHRWSGLGGSLRPSHRRAVVGGQAHQPGRVALGGLSTRPSRRARHYRLRPAPARDLLGAGLRARLGARRRVRPSGLCSARRSSRFTWPGTGPISRSGSPTRAPSSARLPCAGTPKRSVSCRGTAASPRPVAPAFTLRCGWQRTPSATGSPCRSPSTAASGSTSRRSARTRRSRSSPTTAIRASRATGCRPSARWRRIVSPRAGRSPRWAGTIPRLGTARRRGETPSTARASASSWSIRWITIEWRSAAGSTPVSSSCSLSLRCGWWRSCREPGCIRSST